MIDGNLALQDFPCIRELKRFPRPKDQEIFAATPWKKGNTGRTKRVDYNTKFEMFYRFVNTSKLLDKKKCPVKKQAKTQYLHGGQTDSMGSPKVAVDPDPRDEVVVSGGGLSVFSNLPSVQAARKETPRLNISYDCEYKRVALSEYRLITSYQFAVYMPDEKTILEVIFMSVINDVKNRLYLRTCIGAILDLLVEFNAMDVISAAYAVTRRWNLNERIPYFVGSDDAYQHRHTFKSLKEAKEFKSSNENPLVVVDKEAYQSNDFSDFKKDGVPLEIGIICHTGIVDLPAFKDDIFGFRKKKGNIIPYLNSLQGGLTSTYPYFVNIPSAKEYWKFYPVNIVFRDTMCCAPADGKSLSRLGECVGVPKIKLPKGVIANMDRYLKEHPDDYMAYAVEDALVTLMYGSRLWGVNKDWPLTSTSGSCFAMQDGIAKYLGISRDKNGRINKKEFDRVYRGYKDVKKGKISTPVGLREMKNKEPISYEAGQLHDFAAASYAGGFNTNTFPGVFTGHITYDHDLENAYATGMCLVFDIDMEDPIEREFKNEELTLQAFRTPVDPLFALVDFGFPAIVKYPCIAIHEEGSLVFPRSAESVYVSGPSLYLALKLGAKIFVRRGYLARIKLTEAGTPSMSLRAACKQVVNDRAIAKKLYDKGSVEELLLKLFVNGSYGKIAQDVIEKHTWDGWNEYMQDIGYSAITSPERAALITDVVRCMLIGTMNQLDEMGLKTYSVTTDGFICDANLKELNSVDCYGFRALYEDARLWLTGDDPTIWATKHAQTKLINPTTRCNIGFGEVFDEQGKPFKGVLAHGGVATYHSEYDYGTEKEAVEEYVSKIADDDDFGGPEYKDSPKDKHRMAELILKREHRVLYVSREFPNIKDLGPAGKMKDFQTFYQSHQIKLDFDLKRKPVRETIKDVSGEIEGIDFTYAVFETEPFENLEEYRLYRSVAESFSCLRTKSEWDAFYLKMEDRMTGYKRHTPDEWTKLMSVIQGYRYGLWFLPELDECRNEDGSMDVKKVLTVINDHNHSSREFKESSWKNSRKPERASQMLPEEMIRDLLEEFDYIPNDRVLVNDMCDYTEDSETR